MTTRASRWSAGIGWLSAAIVAYEIALMQLLSIQQWHHFAYMVISIALLGFGASGTALAIRRSWFLRHTDFVLPAAAAASAVLMLVVPGLAGSSFAGFDTNLLFVERGHLIALAATFVLYAAPFFAGGLVIGLALAAETEKTSLLYAANLAGSAAGGVLALAGMIGLHPTLVVPLAAGPAVVSTWVLVPRSRWANWSLLPLLAAYLAVALLSAGEVPLSQYKDLSRTLLLPDARVVRERPSPAGFLQLVEAPSLRHAPGLSLVYPGEAPVQPVLFSNGDWYDVIPAAGAADTLLVLDYTTSILPYRDFSGGHALVLEARAGAQVVQALAHGADQVSAVESHPGGPAIALEASGGSGPYVDPRVVLFNSDSRTFLSRPGPSFDLVVWPTIGSFGGSGGLSALQEQFLLTEEGFRSTWGRLSSHGRMAVTVWMDYPYRRSLRLLRLLLDGLRQEVGADWQNHLAAVRSWGTITFEVSRAPLSPAEPARIAALCDRLGFDPLLLPGEPVSIRSDRHQLQDETFFDLIDGLLGADSSVLAQYPFDLRPPTDDRPYFTQMLRLRDYRVLRDEFGATGAPFLEMGLLVAVFTLLIAILLSVVLILLPLRRVGREGGGRVRTGFYFGCLGGAYMLVELVLIQRLSLVFGLPLYAATVVLSVLLLASGLGSHVSGRVDATRFNCARAAGSAAVCLLLLTTGLPVLVPALLQLAVPARVGIGMLMIALVGFAMGFPFPLGLRELDTHHRSHIPWAWGVNGCLSVIGANAAILFTVRFGFTSVLVLAIALYAAAATSCLVPQGRPMPERCA